MLLSFFAVAAVTTACVGNDGKSRWHELPHKPEFRQNPNPKEKYELTVTVEDAPGPLKLVSGNAWFDAPDCAYMVSRLAGASAKPSDRVRVDYVKTAENTWKGTFYSDAMLDEDYDGPDGAMLPCHWRLNRVSASFSASDSPEKTRFHSGISTLNGVPIGKPTPNYFQKQIYPKDPVLVGIGVYGQINRDAISPEIGDSDLFTVTLLAERIEQ